MYRMQDLLLPANTAFHAMQVPLPIILLPLHILPQAQMLLQESQMREHNTVYLEQSSHLVSELHTSRHSLYPSVLRSAPSMPDSQVLRSFHDLIKFRGCTHVPSDR